MGRTISCALAQQNIISTSRRAHPLFVIYYVVLVVVVHEAAEKDFGVIWLICLPVTPHFFP